MSATFSQVQAHNNGDCWAPTCDLCEFEDAQEADDAPKLPTCHNCDGDLDETAWADDWTVIGPDGCRTETRYTCDDCADGAA